MTPSEPLLDFDAMLAPIPGEKPAGSSVPFDVRDKFEEDRKEEDPSSYAEDDPMRPEKFKKADWPGIATRAKEILTSSSKDLLTAARLTEALVQMHGFPGARDGFHLLRLMVEQCWDRLQPEIEEADDIELRASAFNWLDDPDRGARFPSTLRAVPMVKGEAGELSLLDWQNAQEGKGEVAREDFDKAIMNTPMDQCRASVEALKQSKEDLEQITSVLKEKMADESPALLKLRQAVEDCLHLAEHVVEFKGPAEDEAVEGGAEGASAASGGATGGRTASTRAEAYRQLAQAAAVLQHLEPHSPIPYLIQRAVALGAMPFPDLMKALIREQSVLDELSREFGLAKDSESS